MAIASECQRGTGDPRSSQPSHPETGAIMAFISRGGAALLDCSSAFWPRPPGRIPTKTRSTSSARPAKAASSSTRRRLRGVPDHRQGRRRRRRGARTARAASTRKGRYIGDTSMTQVTVGFQLGGEGFSEIIFFENQRALPGTSRRATSSSARRPRRSRSLRRPAFKDGHPPALRGRRQRHQGRRQDEGPPAITRAWPRSPSSRAV